MSENFKNLLHLLSGAALEYPIDTERDYDWDGIYALSKSHSVDAIVFPVIKREQAAFRTPPCKELYEKWYNRFLVAVSFSVNRGEYVSSLVKRLSANGINYSILKGEALSGLYAHPETRISSDVDIWIYNHADIPKVLEILKDDGFNIHNADEESHQIECVHPQYGLIEVHRDICDSLAKEVWFKKMVAFEEALREEIGFNGTPFKTLGITDGAIFVAFHFIKHFLSHGCGCRQLTDMLLYIKKFKNEISFERFDALFGELLYLDFIAVCKALGNKYMQMDFEVSPSATEDDLIDKVCDDIESAGVFGTDEEFRKNFSTLYSYRRSKKSLRGKRATVKYQTTKIKSFIKARNYNIIHICRDLLARKNVATRNKAAEERIGLFEKLGFFDN